MKLARWVGYVATLATMLAAGVAHAQTGSLSGRVTDESGAAISGAEVRVEGTSLHTSTDDDGRFELRDVPLGPHTLRVLMLGFKVLARQVTVGAGPSSLELRMERSVIPLAAVGDMP